MHPATLVFYFYLQYTALYPSVTSEQIELPIKIIRSVSVKAKKPSREKIPYLVKLTTLHTCTCIHMYMFM